MRGCKAAFILATISPHGERHPAHGHDRKHRAFNCVSRSDQHAAMNS